MKHRLALFAALLLTPLTAARAEKPIDIGSRRELFVDRTLVGELTLYAESKDGIARTSARRSTSTACR